MSLPTPTIATSPGQQHSFANMDPKALQAMEAPMMALANSAGGDLRKLLFAFFSFLHRRTDFYLVPNADDLKLGKAKMGFPEGEAEKFLLAAFRQFPLRRIPKQQEGGGDVSVSGDSGKGGEPKVPASAKPVTKDSKPKGETSKDAAKSAEKKSSTTTTPDKSPTPPVDAKTKETDQSDDKIRYTEEGLQVPVGNGGSTKQYKWTQTIEECTVLVGIPDGMRAKELDVSIKSSSIHVKTKKKANDSKDEVFTFVEGSLVDKVETDECTWSLEGGVMIMILYKVKKTFWATVIDGDEKIDTSLVDSRRHISSYDEATQGQLRKIMFDQKQQDKGLPTSDDLTGTKTIPTMPPGVEYIDRNTELVKDGGKKFNKK